MVLLVGSTKFIFPPQVLKYYDNFKKLTLEMFIPYEVINILFINGSWLPIILYKD